MRIDRLLSASFVVAIAACGDAQSGSLLDRYGGSSSSGATGPTSSSASGTGQTGSSSSSGGAGSTGTGSGSTSSTPTSSSDGGTVVVSGDAGSAGRQLFEALLPTFDTNCGNACHTNGGAGAPPYLGGADPYVTIQTYQGMIANPATQSILLTKGQHEGPALTDPLKTDLTNWLTAEAAVLAASGPPTTPPITVATGANTVDLSKLGVAGASLTFSASVSGDILSLSSLSLVAPATSGVSVVFPLFTINGAGGTQTQDQDLSNVNQTVAAGATAALGSGLLIITGWAATDTLQISFTTLAAASAADAGASGGCKAVATFTANAVPAIQNNTCLNCHNTGGSGNASLDLSALALGTPNDAVACAQALGRINTTTPAQSDIILAPTGKVANHPYTSAPASYVTMMETWIAAEK